MSTTTRTTSPSNTSQPTETTTYTTTEHYSMQTNKSQGRERRTRRSIAAHLCITIRGCGQASGLPRTAPTSVDLHKIVARWSAC
jgi:outer membrane PBP1 activator LpoA protein